MVFTGTGWSATGRLLFENGPKSPFSLVFVLFQKAEVLPPVDNKTKQVKETKSTDWFTEKKVE